MASTSERTLRISEKQFMAQVIQLARMCGWLCYHTFTSRCSPAGYPDLCMVRPPSVLFVELKTDTGRPSPSQRVWLEALARCPGVECHLWRPGDWDAIAERLKAR